MHNFWLAVNQGILDGANAACGTACNKSVLTTVFANVTNVLIFLVGSISVIMIILGGLRYVTSGGDAKAVSAAKDTILYAVIGVVISIIAYAIVAYVAGAIH